MCVCKCMNVYVCKCERRHVWGVYVMYVLLNRIHNNSINTYPTSTIIYNLWYAYNLTKKEFMI
jgi:hypothetical protein